jgi:hypothetical protein
MAKTLQQVLKPPVNKLTQDLNKGVPSSTLQQSILPPSQRGGGHGYIGENPLSPTGYSDTLGQPVSVSPQALTASTSPRAQIALPPQIEQAGFTPIPIASQSQGTLYEKQIDTFNAPTGQRVPITEVYYKDALGERVATPEEQRYFRERTNVLVATTKEQEQDKRLQFRRDVLQGKSGVFMVIPYAAQKVERGLEYLPIVGEKIARAEKITATQALDIPINVPFIGETRFPTTMIANSIIYSAPLAMFDVVKIVNKPKITKISSQVKTSQAIETQILVRTNKDEIKVFGQYGIKTKVTPPKIKITTPLREYLGVEPIYKGLSGEVRTYLTKTPFLSPVTGEKVTILEASQRGKGISFIEGTQENINPFIRFPKQLTNIDKRLVRELTGLAPEKFTTKLLSKDADYFLSDLATTKVFKGAKSTKLSKLTPIRFMEKVKTLEGKRITRARVFSEVKEITPKRELPYEVYAERLVAKETTMPFARASGKIRELTGRIYRMKEPIPESDFYPTMDLKTSFQQIELKANLPKANNAMEQTITQQAAKRKVIPLQKAFPKVPTIRIGTIESRAIFQKTFVSPSIVEKQIFREELLPQSREVIIMKESPIEQNINKEVSKEQTKNINKEISKEMSKSISKNISKEMVKEISKEQQKQIEKQMEKQIEKPITKSISPKSTYPFFRAPKIFATKVKLPKKEKSKSILSKAYSIQIKRRGKFIPIASGLPRGVALKQLQGTLLSNIARTGKLVEAGTTEMSDISFKPSERIFRSFAQKKGKRMEMPNTFVQRSAYNLQSSGEQEMIQQAKRLKNAMGYIG